MSDHLLLKTRKTWFEGAVSQALKYRGSNTLTAIAAAESLELTKFIPMLVNLGETGETEEIRQRATSARSNWHIFWVGERDATVTHRRSATRLWKDCTSH